MAVINMRELARNTSQVVDDVHRSGQAALVTRAGKPIVAMIPIDEDAIADWVLAQSPAFKSSLRTADVDLERGRAVTFEEFLVRNSSPRATAAKKTAKSRARGR